MNESSTAYTVVLRPSAKASDATATATKPLRLARERRSKGARDQGSGGICDLTQSVGQLTSLAFGCGTTPSRIRTFFARFEVRRTPSSLADNALRAPSLRHTSCSPTSQVHV